MLNEMMRVGGKTFLVLTDNTTSQGSVDNKKSKDCAVNDEWKIIQKLLEKYHCDIVAERVKSGDNLADLLSRGKDSRDAHNCVVIDLPPDLQGVVKQVL